MKYLSIFLLGIWSTLALAQDINQVDAQGRKQGKWRGYFEESKRLRYEGQFDQGREVGIFTYYDDTKANTVVATRDFSKTPGSAYTIFYDTKKNKVSEGNVIGKQYDGLWTYYHHQSPAVMATEFYKNGKLEGLRKVFYKNGKLAEETMYSNGVKNGPYRKITESGVVLEESNYVAGKFDGPAVFRDGDGQLVSKGNFKAGAKNGYWEFYKNGKLEKKEKYPIRKPRLMKNASVSKVAVPGGASKP